MTIYLLRYVTLLAAALLAGVSFGIWIGFDPSHLSATAYVEQQQSMLGALRVLMVGLVFGATFLTIALAVSQRSNKPVFYALVVAAMFFVACILITRFGNKPIDDVVMTWTTDTLPDNWTELRDTWVSLHTWRTFTECVALCIIAWVSLRKDG
jgi:hypothetical protein